MCTKRSLAQEALSFPRSTYRTPLPRTTEEYKEVRTLDGRVFKDVRASAVPGKVQIETRDGRTIEFKMSELKPYPVG